MCGLNCVWQGICHKGDVTQGMNTVNTFPLKSEVLRVKCIQKNSRLGISRLWNVLQMVNIYVSDLIQFAIGCT